MKNNASKKGELIYDYKYDLLIIKTKNKEYKESIEFQNFVIDLDNKKKIIGMRIFDASKVLNANKYVLKNITKAEFKAKSKNKQITIMLKLIAKQRNKLVLSKQSIFQNISFKHNLRDSECLAIV